MFVCLGLFVDLLACQKIAFRRRWLTAIVTYARQKRSRKSLTAHLREDNSMHSITLIIPGIAVLLSLNQFEFEGEESEIGFPQNIITVIIVSAIRTKPETVVGVFFSL